MAGLRASPLPAPTGHVGIGCPGHALGTWAKRRGFPPSENVMSKHQVLAEALPRQPPQPPHGAGPGARPALRLRPRAKGSSHLPEVTEQSPCRQPCLSDVPGSSLATTLDDLPLDGPSPSAREATPAWRPPQDGLKQAQLMTEVARGGRDATACARAWGAVQE